jgi:diguanylate cyclase (GGDEF)-like protein
MLVAGRPDPQAPADTQAAPARPRLDPYGQTRLARWLLDPLAALPQPAQADLISAIDLSWPGIIASFLNYILLNLFGICLVHGPLFVFFTGLLAVNLGCSALRLTALRLVRQGGAPWRTDVYLFATLAWCLCQGVLTGAAVYSGMAALGVLGAASAMAPQAAMAARNFPAPRFAIAIAIAIDLPFVLGAVVAPNHWLLGLALFTPGYLVGVWASIRYFQSLTIENFLARIASSAQARSDPLTGVLNRRGMAEALAGARQRRQLTLFCLDLDGFKQVNDAYGHAAGDMLLKQVTARLTGMARAEDSVARIGGDEFSLAAPGLSPPAAETMAARIVAAVSTEPYDLGGGIVARVGGSVGYACCPEDGASIEALSARADAALYEVKQRGKGSWQRAPRRATGWPAD